MGMFQPQNYGADFIGAMSATTGMLNDQRKMDMLEKQQAEQDKRYAAEAETRTLTNQGLTLDNEKKSADVAREKKLGAFLDLSGRLNSGTLTPDDYGSLAGVTSDLLKETPYLPSDPAEIPRYKQALATVIKGAEGIRKLPASNYIYTRADKNPEIDAVLDSYQTLLSKERLGKTFTDADGSVTGTPGMTYQTAGVGGFAMASGEGDQAAFTPLFAIADEKGNAIVKADGSPIMVPATEGQTNGPQDKIRRVTPEEMLTKAGYAYKVLEVADRLGLADPEKRKEYLRGTLPAYMGAEEGAKALAKSLEPKESKLTSHNPEYDLYQDGKKVQEGKPKEKEDKPPTTRTYKKDGYEITEEYAGDKKWKVIGKNKIEKGKSDGEKKAEGTAAGQRRSIKEIIDEYQALKAKRSQQFADDSAELRKNNNSAKGDAYGQTPPPKSYEEYYGGKESKAHAAITQAMYQLRDVAKNSYGYDLINMKPMEQGAPAKGMAAPAQKPAANQTAAQPKAKPITATNGQTRQRIVSYDNGASWQPMK